MTTPAASTHPANAAATAPATTTTTAVIGAGIAGLTLAAALQAHGHAVTVFEKSRGPGGRCATRRTAAGLFDHGAAALTPATPEFAAQVAAWQAQGRAAAHGGGHVGVPSMNALARHLGAGVAVRDSTHITALEKADAGWALRTLGGELLAPRYAHVLVAVPAEQAAALLQPDAALSAAMRAVHSEPCWTVMAAWAGPLPLTGRGAEAWASGDALAPVATARRDDAQPGREPVPGVASRWVLHATPHWTRHNLDVPPAAVARHLLAAWAEALGLRIARPAFSVAHRWLYAQVPGPHADRFGWNASLGLGACGDAWHATPGAAGVERAWLSARGLAAALAAPVT